MNPLTFDREGLIRRLDQVSPRGRAQFALACASRLLPLYERFHDETGQGEPARLTHALQRARERLSGSDTSDAELAQLAEQLQDLVPVEDDHWTDWSAPAQNAVAAAIYAIRSCLTGSSEEASWAALQGYEAADLEAADAIGADFNERSIEQRIVSAQPVQVELAEQARLLLELEESEPL